jgi:hypothetical protein
MPQLPGQSSLELAGASSQEWEPHRRRGVLKKGIGLANETRHRWRLAVPRGFLVSSARAEYPFRSKPVIADQPLIGGVDRVSIFLLARLVTAPKSTPDGGWRQSALGFHCENLKAFLHDAKRFVLCQILHN